MAAHEYDFYGYLAQKIEMKTKTFSYIGAFKGIWHYSQLIILQAPGGLRLSFRSINTTAFALSAMNL
ncbi:MAG: hypothetical protein HQ517_14655 [SAR324 cluster bacterium]|nr:hypothetical protein [SAR324 cluster bacterium]